MYFLQTVLHIFHNVLAGEFVSQSRASLVGVNVTYQSDLNVRFAGDIVRKKG